MVVIITVCRGGVAQDQTMHEIACAFKLLKGHCWLIAALVHL